MIDTHCHLHTMSSTGSQRETHTIWTKDPTLTVQTVVEDARMAGVDSLLCVGCDVADSVLATEFVHNRPGCYASIGIHPHEAQAYVTDSAQLKAFAQLTGRPKVVAVGECGLDYYYHHSTPADQVTILKFQIELALAHDLPLIFHVREALDDFWPIFDSYHTTTKPLRGVLHSFTDNQEHLQKALQRGLYIGVNGIATFTKNETQQAMYKAIPSNRLLLETDAPFLTPVPYRGTINQSKYISVIAEFMAQLRKEPIEELSAMTTRNAHALFGLT